MASSFASQIPSLIWLLQKIKPSRVLDIGKGFGKYGFLIHEYVGIDNTRKIDPSKSMKEQSRILVDAVEVDPDLMLPHLNQFYNQIYFGDVLEIYQKLPVYELILMLDIIEHIDKERALKMLEHFLSKDSIIIISTPVAFFKQILYESEFENHVSHWTIKDFRNIGYTDVQYIDAAAVYLLSKTPMDIVGYGNGWIKKFKRLGRTFKNEMRF